jgi:hypothetical protein
MKRATVIMDDGVQICTVFTKNYFAAQTTRRLEEIVSGAAVVPHPINWPELAQVLVERLKLVEDADTEVFHGDCCTCFD